MVPWSSILMNSICMHDWPWRSSGRIVLAVLLGVLLSLPLGVLLSLLLGVLLSLLLGAPVAAQETPRRSAGELIDLSHFAAEELLAGRLSDDVVTRQTEVLQALTQLLKGARHQDVPPAESSTSSRPATTSAEGSQPEAPDTGGAASAGGSSAQGTASGLPTGQAPEDVGDLKRRTGLADAVWGHLPPRMRDELYRSYSDRYVPRYDGLLRRYFEALAESASSSPAERTGR